MKITTGSRLLLAWMALGLVSCDLAVEEETSMFQRLSPDKSGIIFSNIINTSDSINILRYEYLYNGGGVGVGDFDRDGLPDLFFSGNQVPGRLYLNKGGLSFEDITITSGIHTEGVWAYGVSVVDINQDGWPDIYLSAGGRGNSDSHPNKLYVNQGDLTFKEEALEYGLADPGESIQAAWLDYDRDGDLDMYLLTGGGFERPAITLRPLQVDGSARNTDRLYRNDYNEELQHPQFTNVSSEAGILHEGFGLGVSIVDINDDGWQDIYVTNDYLSPDHLYVNMRDGSFSEKSQEFFMHSSHFAMGNDAGDINNDGLIDLVALDMLPNGHYRRMLMYGPNDYNRFHMAVKMGYGHQHMRNTLQLNRGKGKFSEIGQMAGVHQSDWSWAALLADLDNDSHQDLFVSNGFGKDITDLDFVKFRREVAQLKSLEEREEKLLAALEERPPIKVRNMAFRNKGDLRFESVGQAWGLKEASLSNGAAYADLDLDGDLDLVVNNIDEEVFLYRNTLREGGGTQCNYLQIKLKGPHLNRSGIGSKATLFTGAEQQARWQQPVRGYISSIGEILHFGLGDRTMIDSLIVDWPDGRISRAYSIRVNRLVEVDYQSAEGALPEEIPATKLLVSQNQRIIDFKHQEKEFNDFNFQPLLLHKFSQEGPTMASDDVNGDGLQDVFIGGAYHQRAGLFLQESGGGFIPVDFPFVDSAAEDTGSLFFDADGDGDPDLYVVSGSSEYPAGHRMLQDRRYLNDGRGNYKKSDHALPEINASGSCVVASDFDGDGDLDLFVGGRVVPHHYPEAPRSYLLRNDQGSFTDITAQAGPELSQIGMVSSALWADVDADGSDDLILAGEAMPVQVFLNRSGHFVNATASAGLGDSDGFWSSLASGDFDGDGDIDLVAGNLGLNNPYHASVEHPLTIYYSDFDKNGSVEPFTGVWEEDGLYPLHSLDLIGQQIPSLKKHILHYSDYAHTGLVDLVELAGSEGHRSLFVKTLASSYFENKGDGTFSIRPLPKEAQMGPLNAFLVEDINMDGIADILAVGNSYATEVVTGRYDAQQGLVMFGDREEGLISIPLDQSGFYIHGDAKSLISLGITAHKGKLVIVGFNDDYPQLFSYSQKEKLSLTLK